MRHNHLPTLKDVARLAGVSYQTVSNVINGETRITEETRQRVMRAIDQLGYQPHAAARSLRSGNSKIIGLMIPDAQNPHFWDTVTGAEEEANRHGYSLLLATTSMDAEREKAAFHALQSQRLDGLIPLLTYPENFTADLKALKSRNVPVALSASGAPIPATAEVDVVQVHFEEAAYELMQHLFSLGHRRIAMIWGVGRSELGNDRASAYRQAYAQAGYECDPRWFVSCGFRLQDGFHGAEGLLEMDNPPTAIIGINDLIAFGAMQAVLRRGLRVPEDISVAGFDDIPMSSLLSPPLTTGQADGARIGQECVRLIIERIHNPDLPPQRVHLSTHLVIRGSTGIAAQSNAAAQGSAAVQNTAAPLATQHAGLSLIRQGYPWSS